MQIPVAYSRWISAISRSLLGREPRYTFLQALVFAFEQASPEGDHSLEEQFQNTAISESMSAAERRTFDALRDLYRLRKLSHPQGGRGKQALQESFVYLKTARKEAAEKLSLSEAAIQDITDAAMTVSRLYRKLYQAASGEFPELTQAARALYQDLIGGDFVLDRARTQIEALIDSMLRDHGVPFLVLNLIRRNQVVAARDLAQFILGSEEIDEEIRSTVYWIAEIFWFTTVRTENITDHETTLRYLYHLCFTSPDRAGFLELDSQFFSQFAMINELAQEGFLFKETLVDKVLELWIPYDRLFDSTFQAVLESMTKQKSKIYDERVTWERFWSREREDFARDYLYVVEGNLCYARGQFEDARMYYEKALKIRPELRSAALNLVLCYAKLGLKQEHELLVERLIDGKLHLPSALYVVGNSYMVLGKEAHADAYYEELKKIPSWNRKTEYYRSTFCFEHGLYEQALFYAKIAHEMNPQDSSMKYHLSVCLSATGEKGQALELVKAVGDAPQWLDYFRFTLERDSGRPEEASQTLMRIPREYFDDPDELAEAIEFARQRKDLGLLRHLRRGR